MSRVWNSRTAMSQEKTLKVKLRTPQQRRSPSKYAIDFEGDLLKINTGGKRTAKKRGASPRGVSPEAVRPPRSPSPERGRSRERKKKGKKAVRHRSSSSSSLTSLSSVSRSRSRSRSSSVSSETEEVFGGKTSRTSGAYKAKKKKHKKKHKSHRKSFPTYAGGENAEYYQVLEDGVNREKRADKCRTSKKEIAFIEHTKNRSTTYLKRSGSLILAAKELEIQTHCHISLHIQPTWARGKQYRYLSGSNVHPIRKSEYADRWVGPNMCHVCGEQNDSSLWISCGHTSSRRKQGCTYRVHCHCVGLYYSSAIELGQVPFYCPKHGRYHKKGLEFTDIHFEPHSSRNLDINGRQIMERSDSGSVLVRDSNAPLGSEVIHVIDSTTGLRSAVRVDSTTASGTEMLLHFHSSIVQSAENTGDLTQPMVLELPNETKVSADENVIQTQVVVDQAHLDSATRTSPSKSTRSRRGRITNILQHHQQVVVEQVQENVEQVIKTENELVAENQQIDSVEEVHGEPYAEEQVVSMQEVEVGSEVVADNQMVVVEQVDLQDGNLVQEQVVVQEVEMGSEFVEVPVQSQMVVETEPGQQHQFSPNGTVHVYVSQAQNDGDSGNEGVIVTQAESGGAIVTQADLDGAVVVTQAQGIESGDGRRVVFQMAADNGDQQVDENIAMYSQQTEGEQVVVEGDVNVTPTKLEKVEVDPNEMMPQEVDAANLSPGTEIIHVVDSNTAMVLEVQSDANVETQ